MIEKMYSYLLKNPSMIVLFGNLSTSQINQLRITSTASARKSNGHCLQSKKGGKDQESIQSSTTPDPGYQWDTNERLALENLAPMHVRKALFKH